MNYIGDEYEHLQEQRSRSDAAMNRPIARGDFEPREQATRDAARTRRNRFHLLITIAFIGVLVLARLVLRYFTGA